MADPNARKAANERYFSERNRSVMGSGQQLVENGSTTTLRTATIGGGDGEPAYIIPTYDPKTRKVYDLSKPEERSAAMKMVEPDIKSGKLQPYETWQQAEADLKDFYPRVIKSHITEEASDPSRRLDVEHVGKAEDRRRSEALARMNARVDALEEQDAAAAAPDPNAAGEKDSGRTLADLVNPAGTGEQWWQTAIRNVSPVEFMGGALDYADNAFGTIRDLSAKGDEFLMGLGIPAITSDGLTTDYNKFKDTKNVGDYIPDIGDPNKAGLARSVGKFVAGYATAGRALSGVQSLRTLAESGRFGQSAVAALKGAMSDFTGLNEMEGNLANLVQEFPALENPVSEFLAAKEEDPALVNKLKTAMLGAGFGMAVDGVMAGLKAVRAGRQVQQVTGEMDQLAAGLINEAETQRGMITEVLGNPDDPRLLINSADNVAASSVDNAAAPVFKETRGSEILHGSSSPVNLTEGHYETMNIYGQGFYTTDAADVSDGYMKKGKGGNPSQYVVSPRSDAVLYNLDQQMTPDVRAAIEDLAQVDDAVHDALNSSDEPITTLRQVYDEIRAQSRGADRSADEVQGVFESIQARMEDLGFAGYTHKGKGGPKKLSEHTVRIFFNPVRDVKLTPVAPDFFHQKPPAVPAQNTAKDASVGVDDAARSGATVEPLAAIDGNPIAIEEKAVGADQVLSIRAGGASFYAVNKNGALHVRTVSVPESIRGQGHGVSLYIEALRLAKERGLGFVSDRTISPSARRVYAALERRGIKFSRITQLRQEGFSLSADDVQNLDLGKIQRGVDASAATVAVAPKANAGGRVGEVFVNWSRIDSEDDVKNVIQELANRHSDSLGEATRGVQSFGDTQAAAATEDAWKLLQERRQGQPLNAEQTFAVRELWTSSGTAVRDLSRKVAAGGSVADQIALKKMIAVHATIQEQVIGIRTETARALSQWRIPAGESDQFLNGMRDLMDKMGTSRDVMQIAERINQLDSMGRADAADAFINGASKLDDLKKYGQNGADMIRQLFYTSLLSGPKTHVRNAVSNTGMLIANAADRKGASLLGRILGGQNVPDGETAELLYGTWQGIVDAFRISDYSRAMAEAEGRTPHSPVVNAILTGQQGMGIGKLEQPAVGAFDAEKLGFARDSSLGRVLDWIDTATNSPMRALAAGDEVFRTANYNAQIRALSFRQAWQEAESGVIEKAAVATRAAELAGDPGTAVKMMANDYAEKSIFANRPPADSKLFQAMKGISKLPVVGKLAMAFTKTPYNIFIESAQRGPMALVTKKFYQEIGAGGARADIAWTKFLTGNAALIALADIAVKGGITGPQRGIGGENAAGEMENLRRTGEMPMSVKTTADDGSVRTFGYRGMEPFSTHLGLASSLVEILSSDQFDADDKEVEDVVIAAIGAMANQITAPSFMSGLSELVNFQSDPTRNAGNYAERIAGTLVPNAVAEVARAQDPTIREVQGMIDAIKAKTPGLSKTLPANTDRWGKDLTRESGLGTAYDALSPFASTKTKPEPVDLELAALEYPLAKPQKKQWFDGIPVNMKLHPHEYTRYVKLAGNETTSTPEGDPITVNSIGFESEGGGLRDELNAIVQGNHSFSDIYMDESDDDEPGRAKADYIRLIVDAYREQAKHQLLEEFPALRAKVAMRYENARAQGLVPEGNRFLDME